jgi:hypothetical protein
MHRLEVKSGVIKYTVNVAGDKLAMPIMGADGKFAADAVIESNKSGLCRDAERSPTVGAVGKV